jgi:hypothetical protein
LALEEHGAGRQMLRFRARPRWLLSRWVPLLALAGASFWALRDGGWIAGGVLGALALAGTAAGLHDNGAALAAALD